MATQAGKLEQVVPGKRGPMEVGQHLSGANFPVMVHGDHIKDRSDDKKESGVSESGAVLQRWIETTKIPSNPPGPLPNRSRNTATTGINES